MAGAAGDALGAVVEFDSIERIRQKFGPTGITELVPSQYGRVGAITDDTQMTMATAHGLLNAWHRYDQKGIVHVPSVVWFSYRRWYESQLDPKNRRAPGNTCMAALRVNDLEHRGTIDRPINYSKGCGGVMRAAPCGIIDLDDTFRISCELAALTHGHPTGYLAAGAFAVLVRSLMGGESLDRALERATQEALAWPESEELVAALAQTRRAAAIEELGQGWVAEEALAMGLWAVMRQPDDVAACLRLAVNHSGDSDSTGSIAGNIIGALLGYEAIPRAWCQQLEHHDELVVLADKLVHPMMPDATSTPSPARP